MGFFFKICVNRVWLLGIFVLGITLITFDSSKAGFFKKLTPTIELFVDGVVN